MYGKHDYKALYGKGFSGEENMHEAQEWQIQCETVLEDMDLTEIEKENVVVHQLTKDILYWWETQKKRLTVEKFRGLTWTRFKEMYRNP